MAKTFNWCFIGTGKMAKVAARQMALTRSRSHRIVSAYSRTPASAERFVLWFGGKACSSLAEAVQCEGVDAVYIATPHSSHYALAMQCIALGKPVLVEKPFTLNAAQAQALSEAARKNGVYVAEAMWTWFSPIAQTVRQWVEAGRIGEVKTIDIKYAMATSRFYKAPRLFDKAVGGGALLDIGTYPITYCYQLLGMPDEIECTGELNADGVDEGEEITLRYNSGVTCNIRVSLTKYEGREAAIITGTQGVITIPLFHQAVRASLISDSGRDRTLALPTYMTEFDTVAEEIRSGKIDSSIVPQAHSIDVMQILDACRRQMGVHYLQEDANPLE